jgi:hypothetical protein
MARVAKIAIDGKSTYREETLPDLTPEPTLQDYQSAVQGVIDAAAISRRYADGKSMDGYVTSTVPSWASEAQAFVAWRDAVWQYAYSELSKVEAKKRKQPSVADFLLELPEIVWP